jgi:hypothetical protein
MKSRVPVIVKDPVVSEYKDVSPTELITIEEDVFLDGPVSPRVAVLDSSPAPARWPHLLVMCLRGGRGSWVAMRFRSPSAEATRTSIPSPRLCRCSVPCTRRSACLRRTTHSGRVDWAFDAPQLLVVPRAGDMANAFYQRESHSLQFFFFQAESRRIYTSNSQDIIAHETAHALLDGIAPDLYSAVTPQALAIHEAVSDLAALLVSLRCHELTRKVLEHGQGDLSHSNVFSGLAEEFGMALDRNRNYLRNLNEYATIGEPAPVATDRPHDLSTVVSGAFYRMLLATYAELRNQYVTKAPPNPELVPESESSFVAETAVVQQTAAQASPRKAPALAANEKALFVAADRVKRTLLRGLDYLPPGDVHFADLARAVLASDEASHPDSTTMRLWLINEFVRRNVVESPADLDVETNFDHPSLVGLDIEDLIASDFAAYAFAQNNLELLHIPEKTPFEVRPRLDVTKRYFHRDRERLVREVLFKVSWSIIEDNLSGGGLPDRRRYRCGTTLAIGLDRAAPYVRAVITTRRVAADRRATDSMLRALIDSEELYVTASPRAAVDPMSGVILAEVSSDVLRVSGLAGCST